MQLSKTVTLLEATRNSRNIPNTPNEAQIASMRELCVNIVDRVRERYKVVITSLFRGSTLNTAVGGSRTSQHTTGEAVDLDCDNNDDVFFFIKDNLEFDQLIAEGVDNNGKPRWIHCSFSRRRNRKQVLIATFNSRGKATYLPYSVAQWNSIYAMKK